jgi:hypothetical protein
VWVCHRCHLMGKPCSAAQAFLTSETLQIPARARYGDAIVAAIARLIGLQNLIPLLIRPFRLVLPSERLRSARIVLLKATHLPLVVAIWAYEQLANARKHSPSVPSFSGPQTPTQSKRPPRLPVNEPRLLMAAGAPNTIGRVHHTSRSHTQTGSAESDAQLRTLILKLSTQVEDLTAMVSQLQEQREASTPAA